MKKKYGIGDIIKLKDSSEWSDYYDHKGQEATIVNKDHGGVDKDGKDFAYEIKWKDGKPSLIAEDNIILIREASKPAPPVTFQKIVQEVIEELKEV